MPHLAEIRPADTYVCTSSYRSFNIAACLNDTIGTSVKLQSFIIDHNISTVGGPFMYERGMMN